MTRSAWLKWARAVEHQRVLARSQREFLSRHPWNYVRFDNAHATADPLIKMYWRIRITEPTPEQWGVLLGDIFTNLRAALDHVFWAAAVAHSGLPARPQRVMFPISPTTKAFKDSARELQPLVSATFWAGVEAVQPFHGADKAHTDPLEILRWLSNVDKHRFVHVIGTTAVDFGPVLLDFRPKLEIVEQWRHDGPVEDQTVVARLKLKRPRESGPLDLTPAFAYTPTLQISDDPTELRSLSSLMPVMQEHVRDIIFWATHVLGFDQPDPDSLTLGAEHEAVAAEWGGSHLTHHALDGTVSHRQLGEAPDTDTP